MIKPVPSADIFKPPLTINKTARAEMKQQRPCVMWFTGLSGAGKSTTANLVETRLHALGHHTYLLDGDNIRSGLNRDLGFSQTDRVENMRRVAEVAQLMVDAGLIVLVCLISPYRIERGHARKLFNADEFIEVFVDVAVSIAEQRDTKGLYKKARRGDIADFTGISATYEPPGSPEIYLDTSTQLASKCADAVIEYLATNSYL